MKKEKQNKNLKQEKKMKININDKEKIEETLKIANGKARERLVDYDDLIELVRRSEKHLDSFHIPDNKKIGSTLRYREAINCNSYGYRAEATEIEIVRGSKDWFLVSANRTNTGVGRGQKSLWFEIGSKGEEWLRENIITQINSF